MNNLFDRIDELIADAEKAATMENAGLGFPNDRIEIKSVHFGNDDTGRIGDILHPTDYVRNITEPYRRSWIIGPLKQARELLALHADLIKGAGDLREMMEGQEFQSVIRHADKLADKARAGSR